MQRLPQAMGTRAVRAHSQACPHVPPHPRPPRRPAFLPRLPRAPDAPAHRHHIRPCELPARAPAAGRKRPLKITRPKKSFKEAAYITTLFLVWYMSNIYFNIYNKQVLTAFGHAGFCTWIHLAVSSVLAAALWLFRVRQRPRITPRVADIIFPLAIFHLLGFFTTNASLGAVAVSLTHTIKSMEPFFTVAISWLLLGARPAKRILFSLVPIVLGVVVASATDISFNWTGFNAAMLSNVAFQTRNVLSKKAMLRTSFESLEGGAADVAALDEVNIFALMSMAACVIMLPIVAAFELPALLAVSTSPANWMSGELWVKALLAGVCRFGDVLTSFLVLQKVTPVTHSVGNCVKRVVVIAASIVFFKTAASGANIAGTALALSGVFIYSLVKRTVKSAPDYDSALQTTVFENGLIAISPGSLYTRFFAPPPPPTRDSGSEADSDPEYFL